MNIRIPNKDGLNLSESIVVDLKDTEKLPNTLQAIFLNKDDFIYSEISTNIVDHYKALLTNRDLVGRSLINDNIEVTHHFKQDILPELLSARIAKNNDGSLKNISKIEAHISIKTYTNLSFLLNHFDNQLRCQIKPFELKDTTQPYEMLAQHLWSNFFNKNFDWEGFILKHNPNLDSHDTQLTYKLLIDATVAAMSYPTTQVNRLVFGHDTLCDILSPYNLMHIAYGDPQSQPAFSKAKIKPIKTYLKSLPGFKKKKKSINFTNKFFVRHKELTQHIFHALDMENSQVAANDCKFSVVQTNFLITVDTDNGPETYLDNSLSVSEYYSLNESTISELKQTLDSTTLNELSNELTKKVSDLF